MSRARILAILMERVVDHSEVRWFDRVLASGKPLSLAEQDRVRTLIQIGL